MYLKVMNVSAKLTLRHINQDMRTLIGAPHNLWLPCKTIYKLQPHFVINAHEA
jgi:hypothetical protein